MDEQKLDRQDESDIDLSRLLHEFRSVLRRMYWIPLALMLVVGGLWLLRNWRAYTPMYASEVTFTIRVNTNSTSDISNTSSHYDKATAEQLSKTFPYLVHSDYFHAQLRQALGVDRINGSITAATVPDTNLFTLKVTSPDPGDALAILEAVIAVYYDRRRAGVRRTDAGAARRSAGNFPVQSQSYQSAGDQPRLRRRGEPGGHEVGADDEHL